MRPDLSSLWARLLSIAVLVFAVLNASAVVPPNDRCAGAIVIPASGPFPFLTAQAVDITDATSTGDPPLPSCQIDTLAGVSRSVWYQFRPSATDVYHITTCPEAGTGTTVRDTIMAIYTNSTSACGGAYVEIADGCSDDACNRNSEVTTILNANMTYFIVVWQSGTAAPPPGEGLVRVAVERGRPANDDCSNPQPVQLNIPVLGRTLFAHDDYDFGNSLCFTGNGQTPVDTPGLDVVFSFTAPSNGTYSFKVKNYNIAADPNYDLVIYVSPTCPLPDPGGTMNDCLAAANRNLGIAEEVACLLLTNSQIVYIFVDDRYPDNRGSTFTLEVTRCIPEIEPNDLVEASQPFVFETTGSISPIGESDYYSLGMFPVGSRVFALIDAVSAYIPDFDIRVVTLTDTLEFDTDNNDIPYGQSSGSVAGTPLTADCAYLRITHPRVSEPYRIYAVVQPPSSNAVPEIEPNGTPAQAQSSPKNYFSGTLPNMSDEDVYAFDAVLGDVIFLSLDADPLRDRTPIDAQLELLNSAGGVLMLVDDPSATSNTNTVPGSLSANRPFSPAESIVCRATYTGRYYARVSISPYALPGTAAGDYLLSITKNGFIGIGGTNTPPSIVNISAPSVPANTNATLTATIRDPDPGPKFTVTIIWGDGSANTVLPLDVCQYTFQAPHQYPGEGTYAVNFTVTDIYGASSSTATTTIQVTKATAASANIKRISLRPDHSVQLDLQGTPGATYRIEISTDLRNWSTLTSRTADGTGQFQLIDGPPLVQRRFYRAVWP